MVSFSLFTNMLKYSMSLENLFPYVLAYIASLIITTIQLGLQPSFHTTSVVCYFIPKWRDLQFKVATVW